ncbi:MAG: 30S ribosomal protein S4 [Candidatus Thermoplasmatota archaeon]|nr:30S ribosomal protein S4 [Candidatus Thermoplasmatota archaeon]
MGDPRFPHKHYDTPSHPWQKERIEKENALVHQYGLRNKREIWRANTRVREMRHQARSLTANATSVQAQKECKLLLARLNRLGMLEQGADLDEVLRMSVEKLLDRRLQTQVYLQGLAGTPSQARQLITHGHIAIDGTVSRVPGMLVTRLQETLIAYGSGSPLTNDLHPVRPKPRGEADFTNQTTDDDVKTLAKNGKPPEEKAVTNKKELAPKEQPIKADENTAGEAKKDASTAVTDEEKNKAPKTDAKEVPAAATNKIEDDSKTSEVQA